MSKANERAASVGSESEWEISLVIVARSRSLASRSRALLSFSLSRAMAVDDEDDALVTDEYKANEYDVSEASWGVRFTACTRAFRREIHQVLVLFLLFLLNIGYGMLVLPLDACVCVLTVIALACQVTWRTWCLRCLSSPRARATVAWV